MVQKIAKFLNRTLNHEQVQQLCNHLSFKEMKNNESVNFNYCSDVLKEKRISRDEKCRLLWLYLAAQDWFINITCVLYYTASWEKEKLVHGRRKCLRNWLKRLTGGLLRCLRGRLTCINYWFRKKCSLNVCFILILKKRAKIGNFRNFRQLFFFDILVLMTPLISACLYNNIVMI